MKQCWNCGTEIECPDFLYAYVRKLSSFRDRIKEHSVGDMNEEWDQGFLDGLAVAIDMLKVKP